METLTPSSEIIDRIRKLFRLAENQGATEGEASSALAKANELLLRYNLTADRVAAEKGDDRPAQVESDSLDLGRRISWKHRLAVVLARYNFCSPYTFGSNLVFVGRATNVAVTREMFTYIAPQVERLAVDVWQSSGRFTGVHGRTWNTNFYRGITFRIGERLVAERKKLEQQPVATGEPGMALAIRNLLAMTKKENESYLAQHVGKLRSRSTGGGRYSESGYTAGARAGDRVNLHGTALGGAKKALRGA